MNADALRSAILTSPPPENDCFSNLFKNIIIDNSGLHQFVFQLGGECPSII